VTYKKATPLCNIGEEKRREEKRRTLHAIENFKHICIEE